MKQSLTSPLVRVCQLFEGIPEVVILSDDILLDEGLFREGSSGVVIFSAVIVEEDGIIVRVGGVKGMIFFDFL